MDTFAEYVFRADTRELIDYLVQEEDQNPELFALFVELTQQPKLLSGRQVLARLAKPVEDNMRDAFVTLNHRAWPRHELKSLSSSIAKLFQYLDSVATTPNLQKMAYSGKYYLTDFEGINQARNVNEIYARLSTFVQLWNKFKSQINKNFPK